MNIDGTTLIIIILILFALPSLFSTLKDKAPRPRKRATSFRQFPLSAPQDEDFE